MSKEFEVFLFKHKLNEKTLLCLKDKFSEDTIKSIMIDLGCPVLDKLYIYSDGNCKGNGKSYAKAGYSVHFTDDKESKLYKFNKTKLISTLPTNNKAELSGVKQIYKTIYENQELFMNKECTICTDSQYSINCIEIWYKNWIKNDWKNNKKEPVKNRELIEDIIKIKDKISKNVIVNFKHVFGHTKEPINKQSLEWKCWYGNNKVDTNINELFKLIEFKDNQF